MSTALKAGVLVSVLAGALGAGGGYWLGTRQAATPDADKPGALQATAATGERKVLYYRDPMGLPDTSPTPKKDAMGMDYVPVYEDEAAQEAGSPGQIRISVEKVQKLGVRVEAAALRVPDQMVRAAGRIEPDERQVYAVAPKFEGYVERLHVNVTGQLVARGQPLFEAYSPELMSAQREYAIAAQGVDSLKNASAEAQRGMRELAQSSLARLRNWDISDEQIKVLTESGEARRTLTFRSPVAGIVTEKKALQGMRFMAGESLYQVTNLSSVWVIADVFEQDLGLVRTGTQATVRINAYPERVFRGSVAYIYPTLKSETRTVPVRIELANPGGVLKPGMYAQVEWPSVSRGRVLTVPNAAVIDSGLRQLVLVQLQEGRYEPREIKTGARGDGFIEVTAGLRVGEQVVTAANFLIDAESNLRAAIGSFGAAAQGNAQAGDKRPAGGVGHRAEGRIEALDARAGMITIAHGAIASLKWPAMSMEFKLANAALAAGLKPGAAVSFEFVERGQGEWVITALKPPATAAAPATNPHAGH